MPVLPPTTLALNRRGFIKPPASLLNGLVSYHKLEEASGNRLDSSPSGATWTAVNNPGNAIGEAGYCLSLASVSSQYLYRASGPDSQLVKPCAYIVWFKITALPTANQYLLSKWQSGIGAEYGLRMNGTTNYIEWGISTSNGATLVWVTNSIIPTSGTWHMVYCGMNAAGLEFISLDNGAIATATPPAWRAGNAQLTVGADGWSTPASFWNGLIDEVGFWTRELTSAELSYLWNAGVGGKTYPFSDEP